MRRFLAGALIGAASALLVLGGDALLSRSGSNLLETIELKTYDWRLARTARPAEARKDIALVEIDESSLRNLQPNAGRWPWPRAVHSMLIDFLARGPAKVVVYDIDFAEADTRTGFEFGGTTWSGAESDKALADSIRAAGNVILLADASYDGESNAETPLNVPAYSLAAGIYERRSMFPPTPVLAAAASGLGHNLFVLDPDGPIRHTVPFVRNRSRVVPSLGVAAALRVAGITPNELALDGTTLRLGDRAFPLSQRAVASQNGAVSYLWGLIDFRGGATTGDLKTATYPTYTFFDLLYSEQQLLEKAKPDLDPTTFRDKVVFVGATASGLRDVFETPFSNGQMAGIQIHAAVADDILSNRFMHPPIDGIRVATVAGSGLLMGAIAATIPAWWATAAVLAFGAATTWLATARLAAGQWVNLSQPLLTAAFALFGGVGYQYFVEGREKRKMRRLFGQYVSKDVCDELVANPSLAKLGGQRREMTVLFSDIRGFTTVSERGQPEEIVGTLNEYFTRMVDIVFARKGTLDKFVGDMVMALFGAPLDDPQHADHAAEAALDMIAALEALNARWRSEGRPVLDIGIGVNTGPMIAGNIGSDAIMSYTVIGDAVNLGARLESLNKDYGTRIIISEATRARLAGRYEIRPLGDVVVKGKTQPVAIFELVGRAPASTGDEAHA